MIPLLARLPPEEFPAAFRAVLAPHLRRLTLQEAARIVDTSPRTLQRRLAATGSTFARELAAMRRDAAIELLVGSDLKLAAIADRLGFSDASHFARAFRRCSGYAPSDYRRRCRRI